VKRRTKPDPGTPLHVVRLTTSGQPTLIISTTSNYNWIWSDKGSGAYLDVTIWRPGPTDSSFFIIGDYAQGNYSNPSGTAFIVKAINDDPDFPLIKGPVGYSRMWTDKGSGSKYDGSIWYPKAPDGYVSIGFVGQTGRNEPDISNYACLRRDLVEISDAGNLIWNDHHSSADKDVALYKIIGVPNAFVAQGNYNPYSGTAYKIKQTI